MLFSVLLHTHILSPCLWTRGGSLYLPDGIVITDEPRKSGRGRSSWVTSLCAGCAEQIYSIVQQFLEGAITYIMYKGRYFTLHTLHIPCTFSIPHCGAKGKSEGETAALHIGRVPIKSIIRGFNSLCGTPKWENDPMARGSLGSPSLPQSTGAQGSQGRRRRGVAGALTAL